MKTTAETREIVLHIGRELKLLPDSLLDLLAAVHVEPADFLLRCLGDFASDLDVEASDLVTAVTPTALTLVTPTAVTLVTPTAVTPVAPTAVTPVTRESDPAKLWARVLSWVNNAVENLCGAQTLADACAALGITDEKAVESFVGHTNRRFVDAEGFLFSLRLDPVLTILLMLQDRFPVLDAWEKAYEAVGWSELGRLGNCASWPWRSEPRLVPLLSPAKKPILSAPSDFPTVSLLRLCPPSPALIWI